MWRYIDPVGLALFVILILAITLSSCAAPIPLGNCPAGHFTCGVN